VGHVQGGHADRVDMARDAQRHSTFLHVNATFLPPQWMAYRDMTSRTRWNSSIGLFSAFRLVGML
jgi:hypothetical protein